MLNNNTWNHLKLPGKDKYWMELLVLNSNTWNYLTVSKQAKTHMYASTGFGIT